ncbi:MAG: UDP-N-acetylmuramyl-tripeptide synthetase [Candidatus Paceibacterota bacterium]
MHTLKRSLRSLLPSFVLSTYHFLLAVSGALVYGFPSRKLIVVGVTGTDGKSSTTEYINAVFEAAGYTTALSNSIRVKVNEVTRPPTGRSMPGRFFIQRFFREALRSGCTVAIIEMTSEGVRQHRHRAIELDALVFTNLSPEHIESHGSFRAYADAKFEIGRALERSMKRPRTVVANGDDPEGIRYLALNVENKRGFSLKKTLPWSADDKNGSFTFEGQKIDVALPGEFSLKNALAAAEVAAAFHIDIASIQKGVASVKRIPGRLEAINEGQEFKVVVDYALTPDALEKLYSTYDAQKKICIFGATGGGRDTWKRPVLGKLAEKYCENVIVTNDIAYDEDPQKIADDIAGGMAKRPEIILDRREAIRRGLALAQARPDRSDVVVLVTGMGIDTEISAPTGAKEPWNEIAVVREELVRLKTVGHRAEDSIRRV